MRVFVIASFANSLIKFRGDLLSEMVVRGHAVHVAAPCLVADTPLGIQLQSLGLCSLNNVSIRRTGINPFVDLKDMLSMWILMHRIQPDVVLAYTIKPVIYATLAAWLARVPHRYVLITGLGSTFSGEARGFYGIVKAVVQGLYRLALRRCHKVFFQNSDDDALFRQLGLLRPDIPSVVVNGSGINLASFTVAPLPPGPPNFLLIARLLGTKGVREFAQAAQCIKAKHPRVQFSLVGWIDENPDSIKQDELDAWVKAGSLNYHGFLQDVRPVIAQCSVYVLPSYREGTPRSVLEAMAMGRAIITTDAPGCRETVVDGENGFLVSMQSTDALIQAMNRFIDDPKLAPRMGQRSREIAETKYDVHKVNSLMLREIGL